MYTHPHDIEDGRPVILTVGKKSLGKGTPIILAAMPRVLEVWPDALLVMLGKNSEYVTVQAPWLWNAPPVAHDEVPEYLDAARVVCHPSLCVDALPRGVIEAMAAGRCVVGTRRGGIPELITDGVTGFLVEPEPAPLAEALIKALDPDTAIRMGIEGWRRSCVAA